MPLPVIPGGLRVTVAGQCDGGARWANTWAIKVISGVDPDASAILAIHTIFRQLYLGPAVSGGSSVMGACSTGTTLDGFGYTPLDGTSGAIFFPETGVGGATGETLPAQTSAVMTIRTADRGRRNRGRVFLPPFGEEHSDSLGHVNAATRVLLVDQAVGVESELFTGGAQIGVLSTGPYKDPSTGLPVPPGAATTALQHFTPATQFTMDNRFDVIRNRKI